MQTPPGLPNQTRNGSGYVCSRLSLGSGGLSSLCRQEAAIRREFRVFICGTCGKTVRICRRCDRGQRYCSKPCSREARRKSNREAGRRHRKKPLWRRGNRRRQSDYRQRKKSVTHHASARPDPSGTMTAERPTEAAHEQEVKSHAEQAKTQVAQISKSTSGTVRQSPCPRSFLRCDFCRQPLGLERPGSKSGGVDT